MSHKYFQFFYAMWILSMIISLAGAVHLLSFDLFLFIILIICTIISIRGTVYFLAFIVIGEIAWEKNVSTNLALKMFILNRKCKEARRKLFLDGVLCSEDRVIKNIFLIFSIISLILDYVLKNSLFSWSFYPLLIINIINVVTYLWVEHDIRNFNNQEIYYSLSPKIVSEYLDEFIIKNKMDT